MIVEGSKR